MSTIYRIEFETVHIIGKGNRFYGGDGPICRPEDVPEEYWSKVTTIDTDNPWYQYNNLKNWSDTGEQLIRNVKLFESVSPQWKHVESPQPPKENDESQ